MKKPTWAWLWVVLLLKANHKDTKMIWNNNIIVIKEGQFITGRKELAKSSGIAESTIEDILKFLEKSGQIQQQKTTKYRLITIINWKEHQQTNNKATTKQQQADTNKNDNNDKNEKNNINTGEETSQNNNYNSEIKEVIELFGLFNQNNYSWFKNKTQREDIKWLVEKYTLEKVKKAIYLTAFSFNDTFYPSISTPHELREKWSKMKKFYQGKEIKDKRFIQDFEKYMIEKEKKTSDIKIEQTIMGRKVTYNLQK